jgi:hypothetical protein
MKIFNKLFLAFWKKSITVLSSVPSKDRRGGEEWALLKKLNQTYTKNAETQKLGIISQRLGSKACFGNNSNNNNYNNK